MTNRENTCAMPRRSTRSRRAVGETFLVAMIGLSAMISAQAKAQEKATAFAHKYVAAHKDISPAPTLMVHAPTFTSLIETQTSGLPGKRSPLVSSVGIHQGSKAV